jgi:hypothetical protein
MSLDSTTLKEIRQAGLDGARWFVGSQVKMEKPYWDANHGRFIYDHHLDSGSTVLGLNWTQGRGIFCLLAAGELTGRSEFLETAVRAANYIKILQIYDCPDNPRRQFAIREEVPQSWRSAPRDATEAALGLLFMYRATGERDYLRRAVDYEKWFQRNVWNKSKWPLGFLSLVDKSVSPIEYSFQTAHAAFFYYLSKATGKKSYLRHVRHLADEGIKRFVHYDGSIRTKQVDAHHTLPGGEVLNDDGFMVSILCAYRAFGDHKYLDVCQRHSDWIRSAVKFPLPMISGLPCMCTFLIELSEVTGDGVHREWATKMLLKHVLPLQIRNSKDPKIAGAFRGEDEPVEYYGPKTAKKTDFITTRVTAYSTLACLKLAGIVGPYYGALGWERKVRKAPKLDVR